MQVSLAAQVPQDWPQKVLQAAPAASQGQQDAWQGQQLVHQLSQQGGNHQTAHHGNQHPEYGQHQGCH